jgi:hypothetical protein
MARGTDATQVPHAAGKFQRRGSGGAESAEKHCLGHDATCVEALICFLCALCVSASSALKFTSRVRHLHCGWFVFCTIGVFCCRQIDIHGRLPRCSARPRA